MDMSRLPRRDSEATASPEETALLDDELPDADADESAGGMDVQEMEDGSAVVVLPDDMEDGIVSEEFSENLAEMLSESYLNDLGRELDELVETDKKSREQRDKQYAEGIKRTGLGNEAPGGADFEGASRAVHPMLAKGCVDFASRAIKELMPANGPCKTQIIGESTEAKIDKAERKKTYVNWQLTTQVQENRAEFERLLSQLPLGGSQYKRWWYDAALKRNRTETVYVDDVFLPYNQNDFYTSHRVTHVQHISKAEYEARVASGLYRDLKLTPPPIGSSDQTEARQATDKVEGAEEDYTAYNEEGLRDIYQIEVELEPEGDPLNPGRPAPYIMHLDADSSRVLGLYRNWSETDGLCKKKHWMVEYNFIPWRGAYGIGLGHLIGSLAGAATGAIRALLDAAHIDNFPGAVKLKAGRTAGQNITVNATEITEIDAPAGVDDIRKLLMPFPFKGPSNVLMQLLEWLTQQAEVVVTTASEKIADGGADMPMGTALALIEHGSVNFSAIHARLHASLKREMEIVHRLNAENLTDSEVVEELGELVVSREDFQGPMDVIPVSDPNIFSEAQRYAQAQAVLQLKQDPQFAPYFKADRLLQRLLKLLQLPSPEDIANLPKDPQRMGPLQENAAVCEQDPRPLKAYAEQDDLAHLEAHVHFMTSPIYGSNPLIGAQALPALLAHCKDHLIAYYKKQVLAAADAMQYVATMQGTTMDREQAEAKGAAFADMAMAEALGPSIMPGLQAAQKAAMGMAPKPPTDPNVAAQESTKVQTKQMELAYQRERDNADRLENTNATAAASKIAADQQRTDKELATYTSSMQIIRDEAAENSKRVLQEITNQQANFSTVLEAAVKQYGVPPETVALIGQLASGMGDQNTAIATLAQTFASQTAKSEQDIAQIRELLGSLITSLTPQGATQ